MSEEYDVVSIGTGQNRRAFPVCMGHDKYKARLRKWFPNEHAAIDQYFKLIKGLGPMFDHLCYAKMLPKWIIELLIPTGILKLFTQMFSEDLTRQECPKHHKKTEVQ